MSRRYFLLGLLTPFVAVAPLLALFILALAEVGETLRLQDVVDRQLDDHTCLFGAGTFDEFQHYKFLLVGSARPTVVSLGSSRVMQFNKTMFEPEVRFVNAGGLVNSIADLKSAAEQIDFSKIGLVLIGVDPWWFNRQAGMFNVDRPVSRGAERPWGRPTPAMLYQAARVALDGSMVEAVRLEQDGKCRIGIVAHFGNGFWGDGSRSYGTTVTGEAASPDIAFEQTLHFVEIGASWFERTERPDSSAVDGFVEAVRQIAAQGPRVVVFTPPFAPTVWEYMQGFDYGYIATLHDSLKDKGIELHDFSTGRSIDSPDCEFIDGFHGGEITFARILLKLAERDTTVAARISSTLGEVVGRFSGAVTTNWHGQYQRIAPDPLQLGCALR